MDVTSAMVLLCLSAKADVLLLGIVDKMNIPIKGVNNKDASIILEKYKYKMNIPLKTVNILLYVYSNNIFNMMIYLFLFYCYYNSTNHS